MTRTPQMRVRRAPQSTWDLMDETLRLDATSPAFDPDLRQSISDALDTVEDVDQPVQDPEHALYLAAALGAEMATDPRWSRVVEEHSDAFSGWSGLIEQVAAVATALAQTVETRAVIWGETHDQYACLAELADRFLREPDHWRAEECRAHADAALAASRLRPLFKNRRNARKFGAICLTGAGRDL